MYALNAVCIDTEIDVRYRLAQSATKAWSEYALSTYISAASYHIGLLPLDDANAGTNTKLDKHFGSMLKLFKLSGTNGAVFAGFANGDLSGAIWYCSVVTVPGWDPNRIAYSVRALSTGSTSARDFETTTDSAGALVRTSTVVNASVASIQLKVICR